MNDIHEDPAIGFLVMIELSIIQRKLHNDVMLLKVSSLECSQVIVTISDVAVVLELAIVYLGIFQNVGHCAFVVMHLLHCLK